MAHYQVTLSHEVAFEPGKYFKNRPSADRRFVEMADTWRFVQMIRWDKHKPKVIARANRPRQK